MVRGARAGAADPTAVNRIPHFDAHIEITTDTRVIRIDYATPYVRYLPVRLTVIDKHGAAGVSQSSSYPTRRDSFAVEWREFHGDIIRGRKPKTSIADAREDLEIFREIALMPLGGAFDSKRIRTRVGAGS